MINIRRAAEICKGGNRRKSLDINNNTPFVPAYPMYFVKKIEFNIYDKTKS